MARAFQQGLDHARGTFIARMDADDLNHEQRLEKQLSLLRREEGLHAVSCQVTIRKRQDSGALTPPDEGYRRFADWLNRLSTPEAIAAARFIDQPIVNPTLLIRREILEHHGAFRDGLEWAEDYDFWLRLLQAGGRIAKVPEKLYTWTDHPARLTRTSAIYSQEAFIRCKAHYLALLPQVQDRGVALCGAGPIGKAMARALRDCRVTTHHFYEVHPRRIGETIHQCPVLSMDHWGVCEPGKSPVVLGTVGQVGKREHLTTLSRERGHTEGVDFFSTA